MPWAVNRRNTCPPMTCHPWLTRDLGEVQEGVVHVAGKFVEVDHDARCGSEHADRRGIPTGIAAVSSRTVGSAQAARVAIRLVARQKVRRRSRLTVVVAGLPGAHICHSAV